MRRLAITLIAAISFLVCIPCILETFLGADTGGGAYWDVPSQQWLFTPFEPETKEHRFIRIALIPLCSLTPLIWLRGFLLRQRARDRQWRGECHACGYNLQTATSMDPAACPNCRAPTQPIHPAPQRQPGQSIGPGAKARMLFYILLPIGTVLVYLLLLILSPPTF